jgi:hypothetical protein
MIFLNQDFFHKNIAVAENDSNDIWEETNSKRENPIQKLKAFSYLKLLMDDNSSWNGSIFYKVLINRILDYE